MSNPTPLIPTVSILGIPVNILNMQLAVDTIIGWVKEGRSEFICIRDVHGVMLAFEQAEFKKLHMEAGLIAPDGMPLVWLGRLRGHKLIDRVCGADLVDALCDATQGIGIKHFFYGGKPGVAEAMAARLCAKYPQLRLAGVYCPPFRELTSEEDQEITDLICESGAGIVWIGISTPKQEFWMKNHVDRLPGTTLIGVGAAFDFHAGVVKRAPIWMRKNGLEWLHRLALDPRRLWRRYLVLAPKFVWNIILEQLREHSIKLFQRR